MNFLKQAVRKSSKLIKAHIPKFHITTLGSQPKNYVHQKRSFTIYFRNYGPIERLLDTSTSCIAKCRGSRYPISKTAAAISKATGRTPFASTLRPNLTAGAFPRTAGGYGIGGGAYGSHRYFSHTPTPPAQVVQNVSSIFRTLWLSKKSTQANIQIQSMDVKSYNGYDKKNTALNQCYHHSTHPMGSYIDFNIKPTITCFSCITEDVLNMDNLEKNTNHLNTIGFLEDLSKDFSRNTKDLSVIMNDIKRLSNLGDLPITFEESSIIRVHFPGHDFEYVERLCDDLGIQRGIVHQIEDMKKVCDDRFSLVFPYAPNSATVMSSLSDLWSQSLEGYIKSHEFDEDSLLDNIESILENRGRTSDTQISRREYCSSHDESVEGIYRFLEQCDNLRRF